MINQSLIKNPEIENKLKSNVKISKVSKITDKEILNYQFVFTFLHFVFCIHLFFNKYFYSYEYQKKVISVQLIMLLCLEEIGKVSII